LSKRDKIGKYWKTPKRFEQNEEMKENTQFNK